MPELKIIDLSKLDYSFTKKPLVVGGAAMEYYGLRKAGDDVDLIASAKDVADLIKLFPDRVKDLWGDLGICPGKFEIWKSINLLDYDTLRVGAIELREVLIISIEKLLIMKAQAMDREKYLKDTQLIVQRMLDEQYQEYDKIKKENESILDTVKDVIYIEKRESNI